MKALSLLVILLNVALAQYYTQTYQQPAQQGMATNMQYGQQMQYAQPPQQMMYGQQQVPAMRTAAAPAATTAGSSAQNATQQCAHGACCSSTKMFLEAGEPCRATTNPCEELARCNGKSAECPENPKKKNGISCMINGKCTDGFCTEYVCTGLCCDNGKIAADGTACGVEDGKCVSGTCTVYRKADPHIKVLSAEEKEIIETAQKQVKGEIESLLRSHAKYLVKKAQFEETTQKSTLEKIDASLGTNVTGVVSNLTSGSDSSSTSMYVIIAGVAVIALAVIVIFVIKPKERAAASPRRPKQPKKKTKADEDLTSADYDPPAF